MVYVGAMISRELPVETVVPASAYWTIHMVPVGEGVLEVGYTPSFGSLRSIFWAWMSLTALHRTPLGTAAVLRAPSSVLLVGVDVKLLASTCLPHTTFASTFCRGFPLRSAESLS